MPNPTTHLPTPSNIAQTWKDSDETIDLSWNRLVQSCHKKTCKQRSPTHFALSFQITLFPTKNGNNKDHNLSSNSWEHGNQHFAKNRESPEWATTGNCTFLRSDSMLFIDTSKALNTHTSGQCTMSQAKTKWCLPCGLISVWKERFFFTWSKSGGKPTLSATEALQHFTATCRVNARALQPCRYDSFLDLKCVLEPSVHFPQTIRNIRCSAIIVCRVWCGGWGTHHSVSPCKMFVQKAKQLVTWPRWSCVHSLENMPLITIPILHCLLQRMKFHEYSLLLASSCTCSVFLWKDFCHSGI